MSEEIQSVNEIINLYSSLSKEEQKLTREALFELFENDEKRDEEEANAKPIPTFCWISTWWNLTYSQQELFTKCSQEEREAISKIYTIIKGKEIQCHIANLAIEYEDHCERNHKRAEELENEIGNGWRLPNDIVISEKNNTPKPLNLESDYDKMIYYMPGKDDEEKCEKFRMLTWMLKNYWINQKYPAIFPEITAPRFGVWGINFMGWRYRKVDEEHNSSNKVRLIRNIE